MLSVLIVFSASNEEDTAVDDDNQEQTLTKSLVDTEEEETRENKDSEMESSGFKHGSRRLDSDDESGD